ncbi:hypothetical protein PF001_g3057 [Phytophthora fragariae]|uniref:Uncharacterized protein n=1 Tax=Phytophthora fragariae TaxID=53985 RepID=A0A6A3FPI1_9STRA|nr:hypothetical protein PF009_g3222 [Phytophthora fragariae]KAE9025855.1 hypothetical protein PF011_g2839 [Phytophthora fragariae]KAE9325206.1 hypothetical protein PF001_g3057 [Phytophthora fragariae]
MCDRVVWQRAYIRADDANNLRVRKAVFQTPLLPIPALVLQSNSLIPAASPNKWVASSFVFPAPVFTISALNSSVFPMHVPPIKTPSSSLMSMVSASEFMIESVRHSVGAM